MSLRAIAQSVEVPKIVPGIQLKKKLTGIEGAGIRPAV